MFIFIITQCSKEDETLVGGFHSMLFLQAASNVPEET
jgi:hypothetical protein